MLDSPRVALLAVLMFVAGSLPTAGTAQPTPTAEYTVTFDATWSAQTHPSDFPSNAHFSGLIGGTHDGSVTFWQLGALASLGIERMAETGSKTQLTAEVNSAITAGSAAALISGGGIGTSPGSVGAAFQIELDHPLVTVVSMIAPSPDWFVGVNGLSLLESGDWVAEKIVSLWPYDSGTDSGTSYRSFDLDTDPAEPITQISTLPLGNGVPLGTFTFTRTDIPTAVDPRAAPASPAARTTLFQNTPNPFNPSTVIRYSIPESAPVRLVIYDLAGREVLTLVDEVQSAGAYTIPWSGLNKTGGTVASGVYLYRLESESFVQSRRMTLLK